MLRIGHDIGGGNVPDGTDVLSHGPDPAPAEAFLLPRAEVVRVADDAPFSASERNVHNGAFPGHPHGERADRVDRLLGVETDAALAGTAGVIVLAAEAAEDADASVIHANRYAEMVFPQGLAQKVPGGLVKLKEIGHSVELFLGHLERVESLNSHINAPFRV